MNKEIKAYLYPNPPFKGEDLTNIWGDSFEMKNQPFLEVEFFNFFPGKYTVEILSPLKLKKDINIKSSRNTIYFFHDKFADYKLSKVKILIKGEGVKKEFILPLFVYKLSGKVTNFSKKSFPSYLWATKEDDVNFRSIVKTDSNGKFNFYYPEGKKLRLFIDDKSYSKSTFECWVIANTIKSDLKINPKVGDFELYDLQVWFTMGLWYIFFVPASLSLYKQEKNSKWKLKFPPKLTEDDSINILVNNKKVKIKDIIELPTCGKNYYPSYVIVAKPEQEKFISPAVVKVGIDSPSKGRGEAWYIHY